MTAARHTEGAGAFLKGAIQAGLQRIIAVARHRRCRFDLALNRWWSGKADDGPRCNPRVHSALKEGDLRRRLLADISGAQH